METIAAKPIKKIEIFVPQDVVVSVDKRSLAKYISFPFRFLDGKKANLTLIKMEKEKWDAFKEIESIQINFK